MKKDPSRYAAHPYGHAAPWNRQPTPPPPPARVPVAASSVRWPWMVLAALVVAAVGWLVYDVAAGL